MSELGEIVTSLRSFRSVSLAAVASYICKPKKNHVTVRKHFCRFLNLSREGVTNNLRTSKRNCICIEASDGEASLPISMAAIFFIKIAD